LFVSAAFSGRIQPRQLGERPLCDSLHIASGMQIQQRLDVSLKLLPPLVC